MKLPRRQVLSMAAAVAALPAMARTARAQTYPSHPVTLVVSLAAGGPLDTMARIVAEPMGRALGQSVIIENVTGAGGSVGVGRVARAVPDGYTLSMGFFGTHVLNGAIYALPYDVVADFEPIALLSSSPHLVVANPALPAKDLNELIAWLRANQDKASAGMAGIGSTTHVAGVLFRNLIGAHFQLVPYRGAAPALQDVMAGQIDLMVDVASNSLPYVRGGKVRAYAVTAGSRLAAEPEIPTVDEAGLPGLHISSWYALFAPKGIPRDIVARINAAAVKALADPVARQRCADVGLNIPPRDQQTPEALGALQRAEIEKWWPIIKAANIKAE